MTSPYDVVIVGAGPSGLSAALALGRACKRVLVCDAGPRRNAAATHIHNFLTRDGTPPDELRGAARHQLKPYETVEVRDQPVGSITGSAGAFQIGVGDQTVTARRVLLATGMLDTMAKIDGFAEHWGHSIVQCPYCHGWEARGQRWGFLLLPPHGSHIMMFARQLRSWTEDVTMFTHASLELDDQARALLDGAGIRIETAAVERIEGRGGKIESLVLAGGKRVPCDLLYAHPLQRQVPLVAALGLELEEGYVKVDANKRETSIPGIYAAGDLTTRAQGAILAAASGTQAAAVINVDLMT